MLTTPLCHQLGITYPILSVGMGALAGPELAAAVSNAGACGVLGRVAGAPVEHLRQQIRHLRSLTDKPLGVNIILARLQEGWIEVCLEEQVPLLVFFWGDPSPYMHEAHRRGTKVLLQVGSVTEARRAAEAGVDAIIVQGVEAGGHVKSTTALSTLVPEVVEACIPPLSLRRVVSAMVGAWWRHSASVRKPSPWGRVFCAATRRSLHQHTRSVWCRARRWTPSIRPSSM
jgi:nitronate monooxygenase